MRLFVIENTFDVSKFSHDRSRFIGWYVLHLFSHVESMLRSFNSTDVLCTIVIYKTKPSFSFISDYIVLTCF